MQHACLNVYALVRRYRLVGEYVPSWAHKRCFKKEQAQRFRSNMKHIGPILTLKTRRLCNTLVLDQNRRRRNASTVLDCVDPENPMLQNRLSRLLSRFSFHFFSEDKFLAISCATLTRTSTRSIDSREERV